MRTLATIALALALASADIWVTTALFPATLGNNQQLAALLALTILGYFSLLWCCGLLVALLRRFNWLGVVARRAPFLVGTSVTCGLGLLLVNDLRGRDMSPQGWYNEEFLLAGIMGLAIVAGALAERAHSTAQREKLGHTRAISMVLFALLVTGSLLHGGTSTASSKPNVILISLDTLRAGHLSTYGYERNTSPHIDAFADQGVLFERAYAPSHWTLPSHAAMLTGLNPVTLGIISSNDYLAGPYTTLAERFQELDYQTCALVGGSPWSYIGSRRGFEQGFDEYLHVPYPQGYLQSLLMRGFNRAWWKYFAHDIGAATVQVDSAVRWLERSDDRPFFLFLHLFDIHSDSHELPYEAPSPFQEQFLPNGLEGFTGLDSQGVGGSERLKAHTRGERDIAEIEPQLETIIALYDGGIAYTDHEVGRFLRHLEASGIAENTIIAITSDHGESFFEHGVPLHGNLQEPNLHVPLMIRAPGLTPARSKRLVQVQDLVPSLLELAGIESSHRTYQGLKAQPDLNRPSSPVLSSSDVHVALTGEDLKLIHGWDPKEATMDENSGAFYDRHADRGELHPLAPGGSPKQTDLIQDLARRVALKVMLRNAICPDSERGSIELSEDELDALRAIGYGN